MPNEPDSIYRWTDKDARNWLSAPKQSDNKYSRGVLGVVTGSTEYPGAAVIGVDAALHTGVGMVRYLGPREVFPFVLNRRPEAVSAAGKVDAWLFGSGMLVAEGSSSQVQNVATNSEEVPAIFDAGALELAADWPGPKVITPHLGELSRLTGIDQEQIKRDPIGVLENTASELGATILLKGHRTLVCGSGGLIEVVAPTTWLATAGTGDSLAGILGALVASNAQNVKSNPDCLIPLTATASYLHGEAARIASSGGPFTVIDLNRSVSSVIANLLKDASLQN